MKNKIKSNRSAAKRFSLMGSGKVKMARGGKSHLNVKKNSKRMRRLGSALYFEGAPAKRIASYISGK